MRQVTYVVAAIAQQGIWIEKVSHSMDRGRFLLGAERSTSERDMSNEICVTYVPRRPARAGNELKPN